MCHQGGRSSGTECQHLADLTSFGIFLPFWKITYLKNKGTQDHQITAGPQRLYAGHSKVTDRVPARPSVAGSSKPWPAMPKLGG